MNTPPPKKTPALNFEWLTLPWERAPITTTTGSFSGTMSRGLVTFSTWKEVPYFLQPRGRWSLTGFLMTCKHERIMTYIESQLYGLVFTALNTIRILSPNIGIKNNMTKLLGKSFVFKNDFIILWSRTPLKLWYFIKKCQPALQLHNCMPT